MLQKIETKQKGYRCEIQVPDLTGHSILTTYDPDIKESVEIATQDLADFFSDCIEQFEKYGNYGLKPRVFVREVDTPYGEMYPVDIDSDMFDLSKYEQVLVQSMPVVGG